MGQDEATDVELVRQARRGAGDQVDVLVDALAVAPADPDLLTALAEVAMVWIAVLSVERLVTVAPSSSRVQR